VPHKGAQCNALAENVAKEQTMNYIRDLICALVSIVAVTIIAVGLLCTLSAGAIFLACLALVGIGVALAEWVDRRWEPPWR